MHSVNNRQQGFTLFEVLIYIALFTLVIGGGVMTTFRLFDGSAQVQAITEGEIELNFVLRKIDWALNGASNVSVSADQNTLTVLNNAIAYEFTETNDRVTITFAGNEYDLSSDRINITDIEFDLTGTNPQQLDITMEIDGDIVGPITRYIR